MLSLVALLLAVLAPTASADHGQPHSDQAAQNAEDGSDNASETGQGSSEDGSDNASATGQGSSEAGSDNASATGQGSSEDGSDNASATDQGSSEAGSDNASATDQGSSEGNQNGRHGNSGTIKVGPVQANIAPDNVPQVPCQFQLEFFQFPEEAATVSVSFEAQEPSGSGSIPAQPSSYALEHTSEDEPTPNGSVTYDFEALVDDLERHDQRGYHVKVTVKADTAPDGATGKQKVFWVDCGIDSPVDVEGVVSAGGEEATVAGGQGAVPAGDEEATVAGGQDAVSVGDEGATAAGGEEGQDQVEVAGLQITAPGLDTSVRTAVLGSQHEADELQAAPVDATLPRTGISVLALVVGGLLSLGGGEFMRRRTSR